MLQADIDNLVKWSNDWLMSFNDDKCVYMVSNNKHFSIDLRMNGKLMKTTEKERDLGVYICSNLKWTHQVAVAANKARIVLGQLTKAFKCWTEDTFKILYVAFVRPHLEYAIAAWCPHLKKDIMVLENVQRNATKLVKSLRGMSYEDRLAKLGLTTLKVRRERGDLIEYFKITNGLSKVDWHNPNKLCSSLKQDGPAGNIRGNKHRMEKQLTRISQREYFILNRVVENWNGLPSNVLSAKSKNAFKKKLDDYNTDKKLRNIN